MTSEEETNPPRKPRYRKLQTCPGYHRLNLELHGNVPPHRQSLPQPREEVLERVPVGTLEGSHELQRYIIIGERPTWPYSLITIRRTKTAADLDPGFEDRTKGLLSYWSFAHTDPPRKRIREAAVVDYGAGRSVYADYGVSGVFTAWDVERDVIAQVLLWRYCGEGEGAAGEVARLEWRFGPQECHVEMRVGEWGCLGVCFAGVPGGRKGVVVRALFVGEVWFYEPFGGEAQVTDHSYWRTVSPAEFSLDPSYPKDDFRSPRVSVFSAEECAAFFLKGRLKQFQQKRPIFKNCYSTIVPLKRPVRFEPGKRTRTLAVAFGGMEASTRVYQLFIFCVNPANRAVTVSKASAFTSLGTFSWGGMCVHSPEELLRIALRTSFGGAAVEVEDHECARRCEGVGVRVFGCLGDLSLGEIRMEEAGCVLVGWGQEGREVGDGE
ncbi:hypothetical protein RUND412_000582 [Rhizina undulata]